MSAKKGSTPRAKPKASDAGERKEADGGRTSKPVAARTPEAEHKVNRSDSAPERSPFTTPLPPDDARQREAEARVKDSTIERAGIESRLLGHVSASGKRNQALRDSKNG